MSLLKVEGLSTYFFTKKGVVKAVDEVNFNLHKGEILGLIGESGCGKSTLGYSLLRLIEEPGKIDSGKIILLNQDILELEPEAMRKIRWNTISMIPQSAMSALNPVIRIEEQIIEAIMFHKTESSRERALVRTKELLGWVGIDGNRGRCYPHEFSGGMKQRVAIAMALACNPEIVICDEATTGLDVLTEAQVIALIKRLQEELGLSVIFISHDLHIVATISERIAVMYAGHMVEIAPSSEILSLPLHPYTRGLLNSTIDLEDEGECTSISGSVPRLINLPPGCRFYSRCTEAMEICNIVAPKLFTVKDGHQVACFLYGEVQNEKSII